MSQRVFQGDTLASFLFIICLNYGLQTSIKLMKENDFTLKRKKARRRRYPTETIIDANYPNDLKLLANSRGLADSK